MFMLVALLLGPNMTMFWIGYGVFACVMGYVAVLGFKQKCNSYSWLMIMGTIAVGLGIGLIQMAVSNMNQ